MSFHWLRLSPSQCPEYRPWLGKVEREITRGRFPRIWIRALQGNGETEEQEVRAALRSLLTPYRQLWECE